MSDLMKRRNRPSNKSNKINVPEARVAMDKFKMEAASEVGVDLKEGYNGHLTSRGAGSVGGPMVKKICPVRTVTYHRTARTALGHQAQITYRCNFTL